MIPMPNSGPGQQILPAGTLMVTDDLVTALRRIPGTFTPDGRPLAFPTRTGPWLFLPHGSALNVHEDEDGERLVAVHFGDGHLFDKDREILHRHLD